VALSLPIAKNYARIQAEFERLCVSECVQTPRGLGRIWDSKQLREHIERDAVRVQLDGVQLSECFRASELEPVLEVIAAF